MRCSVSLRPFYLAIHSLMTLFPHKRGYGEDTSPAGLTRTAQLMRLCWAWVCLPLNHCHFPDFLVSSHPVSFNTLPQQSRARHSQPELQKLDLMRSLLHSLPLVNDLVSSSSHRVLLTCPRRRMIMSVAPQRFRPEPHRAPHTQLKCFAKVRRPRGAFSFQLRTINHVASLSSR